MKRYINRALTIGRDPVAVNSMVMFIGTMAINFGAYLYHLVVGRIMGPEKYGEFSALFSLLFVLSVPSTVIQIVMTKFFSQYKAHNDLSTAKGFFFYSFKILTIGGVIGGVGYILIVPLLQNFLHIFHFDSFLYIYGIFVTSFYITVCTGALNGFQKFLESSIYATGNMILRFISGFLLAPLGVASALLGIVIANALTLLFYAIPMRFFLKAQNKSTVIPKSEAFLFALPTFLSTLSMTLLFNIDVVLIKHFFTSYDAGVYGALAIFGKIIFFASSAVGIVLFPMISERKAVEKSHDHLVYLGLAIVAVISIAIVLLYAFFGHFMSVLLFGKQFERVAPFLGLYGLFMAGVTIANYLLSITLATNKVKSWVAISVAVALQTIGIGIIHTSLYSVIILNICISWLLSLSLLLYYRYDHSHTKAAFHHNTGL